MENQGIFTAVFFLRIDRFFFLGKTKNRRPVFAFHPLAGRNNGLENMSSISGWIPKIWDIWVCLKMSQPISIQSIPCVSAFPLWKEISACYDCYVVPIPHFQTHQDVWELVPNGLDDHVEKNCQACWAKAKAQWNLEDHTISKKDLLTRIIKHWDEAPIIEASQKLLVFNCKRFSHLKSGLSDFPCDFAGELLCNFYNRTMISLLQTVFLPFIWHFQPIKEGKL